MRNDKDDLGSEGIRAQLEAIVDSIEVSVISIALDGSITGWNRAAEYMFGYRADEMIGRPISILTPSGQLDQRLQIIQNLGRTKGGADYEAQRLRKDGRVIDVHLTYRPVQDQVGVTVGVLEMATDLTERKRLEIAERDQLFLAAIISTAEDAIISKDMNGIVTSWNPAAEKLFGYTAPEIIGKPIAILIPPGHDDEEPQILEKIRRGQCIDHYETQRRGKDGRLIDVSLTVSPIKDRIGRIIGASKIVRDITDRRRWQKAEVAESFLGALVESADDAIVSKTLDGVVTSWNHAAERLFGYTAEEMIGKPVAILIPSDHSNEEPKILERIRRGERIEHYETKRIRKDRRIIDVSLTVSPIKDSLGRIIGASKIARNVTLQKHAESRERLALSQAEEAKRQAEEASRAKDEFLATVSHELRTPMTAIIGWTRMLMTGDVNEETQRKALETIDRNARSQAQLIEDLLDISRIVSGKLRVEFRRVDMATVIAAALEAVRPAAEAKRICIQTVLSSDAGPILGDFERLQQVVWNLLSNAVRFTPADGFVKIELRRADSQIELRVSDNGIGIKREFLPHIFERFSQADSSIKRNHGGIGMGLAIVKSLAELHGGSISVTSAGEGQGSVFSIKLPISAVLEDTVPQLQTLPLDTALKEGHQLVGVKVLLVDDEPDTCELLRFVFNECGSIVETANGAEKALQIFDRWKPDILVSDIGMPNVDGYELIRIIRNDRHSRIPAVALTAMARIDDRIQALNAGYQMHVSKPVEPVELISIVTSLVGLVNRRPGEAAE